MFGIGIQEIIIGLFFILPLYFAPTIVAKRKDHPHTLAIFIVNFLFGLTLIGWVGCLVWALVGIPLTGSLCPYCMGRVPLGAKKCKHCSEWFPIEVDAECIGMISEGEKDFGSN